MIGVGAGAGAGAGVDDIDAAILGAQAKLSDISAGAASE
jgi:hypothetical protein